MSDDIKKDKKQGERVTIKARYEQLSAMFVNQFIINRAEDDILIGFSSGAIEEPGTKDMLLPIHTRVAMSVSSARKLVALLTRAIDASKSTSSRSTEARLPRIESN